MLTEHPLLSEPSSVSFYNWMSNAVGNRTGAGAQDSPVNRSQHNSLQTGQRTWGAFSPPNHVEVCFKLYAAVFSERISGYLDEDSDS